MKQPLRNRLATVLAAAGIAVVLIVPPRGSIAGTGVSASKHDFTTKIIDNGGVCTPCHASHFSPFQVGGWSRSMADEASFYEQDGSSGADYVPGGTLLCYDCHDDNASADGDPAGSVFTNPPQDIALGGSGAGYYEMACGQLPNPATPPTDGSPTGGHYWKTDPGGAPNFARGDKIPCSLCHDPHDKATGANEAFFRVTTWNGFDVINLNDINGYGTNLKASTYNATTLPNGSRNGTGTGRAMCATCHGYSDQGSQAVLYNVTVPKPPGLGAGDVPVPEHARDDSAGATPCVACHGHNRVAGCNECHGYPPLVAEPFNRTTKPDGESYAGGAGAHRRHLDALGASIFNCAICHGPDPGRPTTTWHNENAANCGVPVPGNVDIMGLSAYWDPTGTRTNAGYSGAGSPVPVPTGYEFSAKGGGDRRCSNFACHGDPPDTVGALNWGDDMVDEATGDPVAGGLAICKWCHDATPARIGAGPNAPNVLGDNTGATGVWTTGVWGADVNGHGKASGNYDADAVGEATPAGAPAANKQCTVCHDATYTASAPTKAHYDGLNAENRLRASINGLAVPDEDAVCVNCHQNGGTVDPRTQISMHGNTPTPTPPHSAFARQCRQCHNVHGANWNGTGRNLHMIGTWIDEDGDGVGDAGEGARVDSDATNDVTSITTSDLRVNLTANAGENSYDDGFNDGQHDSVCVVCHRSATMNPSHNPGSSPYNNSVESTANRVSGTHNPIGGDCTSCHKHESDNAVATADAWRPSGCNGCHGWNAGKGASPPAGVLVGQFWPSGSGITPGDLYTWSDDDAGAHVNHVADIGYQIFGETPAQVVTDTAVGSSYEKQRIICAFCHPDPGGANHFVNDSAAPSPAGRVDVLRGGSAGNYFQRFTTGVHATYGRTNYGDDVTALDSTYGFGAQTCANLVCHNQAATPASWDTPPVWATVVNPQCSNIACHAPATYTIAHTTHVNGTKSYACTECHADNTANVQHGNGKVDMKWDNAGSFEAAHGGNGYYDKDGGTTPTAGDTAFAYKTGGAAANDPTYARSCYRVYCHGGDNTAAAPPNWRGSSPSPSPVWNTAGTPLACGTCHADQSTLAGSTARHYPHVANNAWLPDDCGSCHVAPTQTAPPAPPDNSLIRAYPSHVDGDIDLVLAYVSATGDCTNSCHDVAIATPPETADPGDWLDAPNGLACTDCHSGTFIGTAPTSGLHATATAMAHDDRFLDGTLVENATCTNCHLASAPSTTHVAGPDTTATPENSTQTTFNWNADALPAWKLIAYDNTGYAGGSTSCQATCHSDYKLADTGGLWWRAWAGVVDAKPLGTNNPGDAVCDNCHGDGRTGGTVDHVWNLPETNASTTDHTNPYNQGGANPDQMQVPHSVCQTCHGWGHANYTEAWAGAPPAHGDGSITMNGPTPSTGAEYDDATGGCTAACHAASYVLNTTSGWPVNYGDFGSGACEGCHNGEQTQYPLAPNVMGDGTLPGGDPMHSSPQPFDDGSYGYNVNGHGRDGDTSTESHGDPIGVACTACHDIGVPVGTHLDGVLNGRISPDTRNANSFHLVAGFMTTSPPAEEWTAQVTFDNYCYTACHQAASAVDMRHARDTAGIHATPNVSEFGQYNSYPAPMNTPPPEMFYDRNLMALGTRDGEPNFALCVSCHNPHGTNVASPKNTQNNLMMIYKWAQPERLCSKCHR